LANLTSILAKMRQNVIDLPSDTEDRLVSFVNEAQVNAEDEYQFIWMRSSHIMDTAQGDTILSGLPLDWIRADGDPWFRTGDGKRQRMEWSPSELDIAKDFTAGELVTDEGQPDTLFESGADILVYPPPDMKNTTGAFSTAGDYSIKIPYYAREDVLVEGADEENLFTKDANMVLYLEDYASGLAMLFNHDNENGQVYLLKAKVHFNRAKKTDKRKRAQFLRLTPRRDSHASRRQRRAT
jgi:hypothetical protein